jgi:hypothetical protein
VALTYLEIYRCSRFGPVIFGHSETEANAIDAPSPSRDWGRQENYR